MDFIVRTADGETIPFSDPATFDIDPNQVLKIRDPETDRMITYSPSGWHSVEQQLPPKRLPPPGPRVVLLDDEPDIRTMGF